jgi:DDE family transposase
MLPPHLHKFTELYDCYGLGAVKNLWLLTCLIPLARTVNLFKMKDYVGGVLEKENSNPDSDYKRLIRFFQDWGGREDLLHDLMRQNLRFLRALGFKTLAMDGTSWKLGDTDFHYLVLSVLIGSVAVPIFWVQLEKIGASNQEERKAMFEEALLLFDLKGMTLLADREYVGREWFKFLKDNKIHFVIRLRMGDYEEEIDLSKGSSYQRMRLRCVQRKKLVSKRVCLKSQGYTVVMMPNPKPDAEEPVLIFLTTLDNARKAAALYARRWKIECLFKHLKTNGYNLEDLNLKDTGKNLLMMAIVATAYILAIRKGLKRRKQIKAQLYKDGSESPEVSIFREGLARLTAKCFRFIEFIKYVLKALSPKNHAIFKNVQ